MGTFQWFFHCWAPKLAIFKKFLKNFSLGHYFFQLQYIMDVGFNSVDVYIFCFMVAILDFMAAIMNFVTKKNENLKFQNGRFLTNPQWASTNYFSPSYIEKCMAYILPEYVYFSWRPPTVILCPQKWNICWKKIELFNFLCLDLEN